jgi:hypothetical protein
MAQILPGPMRPSGLPIPKGLKGRRGTGSLGVDNGASVLLRALAFLRHERRHLGRGSGEHPPLLKPQAWVGQRL